MLQSSFLKISAFSVKRFYDHKQSVGLATPAESRGVKILVEIIFKQQERGIDIFLAVKKIGELPVRYL